jgi:hypothetical protein
MSRTQKKRAAARHRRLIQFLDRGIDYVSLLALEGATNETLARALQQLRRRIADADMVFPIPSMGEVRRIAEALTPGCGGVHVESLGPAKVDDWLRRNVPPEEEEVGETAKKLAFLEELGVIETRPIGEGEPLLPGGERIDEIAARVSA